MTAPRGLVDVLSYLRCTVCANALLLDAENVRCTNGHAFDIARQGYLNLAVGAASTGSGDTAAMVQARARFLDAEHYRPIADALVAVARSAIDVQLVVDLGGGTGYYLARTLDALVGARGVCLDRSTAALRRAVRAHPHGTAIGCDIWRALPLADGCADVVLDVFSPRNAREIERVLSPGGRLVVVTPTSRHLAELISPLGMLSVDEDKSDRLHSQLQRFTALDEQLVEFELRLDRDQLCDLVLMGPAAWHSSSDDVARRVDRVAVANVTVSVDVTTMMRCDQ